MEEQVKVLEFGDEKVVHPVFGEGVLLKERVCAAGGLVYKSDVVVFACWTVVLQPQEDGTDLNILIANEAVRFIGYPKKGANLEIAKPGDIPPHPSEGKH